MNLQKAGKEQAERALLNEISSLNSRATELETKKKEISATVATLTQCEADLSKNQGIVEKKLAPLREQYNRLKEEVEQLERDKPITEARLKGLYSCNRCL